LSVFVTKFLFYREVDFSSPHAQETTMLSYAIKLTDTVIVSSVLNMR